MARRRTRVTATLAALLVLQLPLCAFACSAAPSPATAAEAAAHDMPCHDGPAPAPAERPPAPAERPPAPEECACGDAAHEALVVPSEQGVNATAPAGLPGRSLPLFPIASNAPTQPVPLATDLPPPDILQRTSILLF